MAISRGGFRRPTGRRIPYSASLRCKFVLRSTTAFCKAKTPNVAPVHRFAVSGSHDQASYEKQKSRCVASTFLFLAGAGGFEPATHGFGAALKHGGFFDFSHILNAFGYGFGSLKLPIFLSDALLMLFSKIQEGLKS